MWALEGSASRTKGTGLPSRAASRVPGARHDLQMQLAGNPKQGPSGARGRPGIGDRAQRSGLRGPGRVLGRSRGGARAGPLHIPSPPRLANGGGGSGGCGGGGSWSRRESSPRGGTRVGIRVRLGSRAGGFGVHLEWCGRAWVRWNLDARDAGLQRGGRGGAGGRIGAGLRAGAMRRDPDLTGDVLGTPSSAFETPCSGSGPSWRRVVPAWSRRPGHLRSLSGWLV